MTAGARPLIWRGNLVPAEHGAWGLFLEPVVLGLLVAPSAPGTLVALAATALFLCRTALLKWWSARRGSGTRSPSRAVVRWGFGWLAVAPVALAGAAVWSGRFGFLLPLAAAVPLAAVQLGAQLRRDARQAEAEMAGALALSAFTPAIALAAGWDVGSAAMLWILPALRSVLSVQYVRTKLRQQRAEEVAAGIPLVLHLAALGALIVLARAGRMPAGAVAAFSVLTLRAGWGLLGRRPLSVRQVGWIEVLMGAIFVGLVAAGYLAAARS